MTVPGNFFVYMLKCSNGALYTGYTSDVKRRFNEHLMNPRGAKFTRGFKALEIAASWAVEGGRGNAMRVESFIKSLTRKEKERLVDDPASLSSGVKESLGIDVDRHDFSR